MGSRTLVAYRRSAPVHTAASMPNACVKTARKSSWITVSELTVSGVTYLVQEHPTPLSHFIQVIDAPLGWAYVRLLVQAFTNVDRHSKCTDVSQRDGSTWLRRPGCIAQSLANAVAVRSNAADAGFLCGLMLEGLNATCAWSWVCPSFFPPQCRPPSCNWSTIKSKLIINLSAEKLDVEIIQRHRHLLQKNTCKIHGSVMACYSEQWMDSKRKMPDWPILYSFLCQIKTKCYAMALPKNWMTVAHMCVIRLINGL